MYPAFRSLDGSHRDAGKDVIQLLDDRSYGFHIEYPATKPEFFSVKAKTD